MPTLEAHWVEPPVAKAAAKQPSPPRGDLTRAMANPRVNWLEDLCVQLCSKLEKCFSKAAGHPGKMEDIAMAEL